MTYSIDLRERVVRAVENSGSVTEVACRFGVAWPTVEGWRDRARRGELEPGCPGPMGPTKLTEADDHLVQQRVAVRSGITARELIPMLSVALIESIRAVVADECINYFDSCGYGDYWCQLL